jgi:hypothetical protein
MKAHTYIDPIGNMFINVNSENFFDNVGHLNIEIKDDFLESKHDKFWLIQNWVDKDNHKIVGKTKLYKNSQSSLYYLNIKHFKKD